MSKVDLTPYLPEIEGYVEAVIAPPFKAYEPMELIGSIGKVIHTAEEIQTEEEYKDVWAQIKEHLVTKYDLFERLDKMFKLPVYAEPFDKWAFEKSFDALGAALAYAAATHIG